MRKEAADNREAIVTAARTLFIEQGADVSLRAIAKEADVGIATVSRHFPDRITLIDAIGAHALHSIENVIDEFLPAFENNPEKAWRDAVHAIAGIKLALLGQALFSEISQSVPEEKIRGIVGPRATEIEDVYARLLAPAKEAGLCPQDLTPLDFHIALAITSRPLPNVDIINNRANELQEDLIDVFLDGLHARATQSTA